MREGRGCTRENEGRERGTRENREGRGGMEDKCAMVICKSGTSP